MVRVKFDGGAQGRAGRLEPGTCADDPNCAPYAPTDASDADTVAPEDLDRGAVDPTSAALPTDPIDGVCEDVLNPCDPVGDVEGIGYDTPGAAVVNPPISGVDYCGIGVVECPQGTDGTIKVDGNLNGCNTYLASIERFKLLSDWISPSALVHL